MPKRNPLLRKITRNLVRARLQKNLAATHLATKLQRWRLPPTQPRIKALVAKRRRPSKAGMETTRDPTVMRLNLHSLPSGSNRGSLLRIHFPAEDEVSRRDQPVVLR